MNTAVADLDFDAMDLEDLAGLAADELVDAETARLAREEIQSRTRRQKGLLGSAGTQSVQRTLDMILTDEAWEQMVDAAQTCVGKTGIPKVAGRTREWSCSYEIGSLTVSATAAGAKTHLKLVSVYNGALRLAWMTGPLIGALVGGLVGRGLWKPGAAKTFPIMIGLAIGLCFVLLTYSAIRVWERRHRPKLLALMTLVSKKLDELGRMPQVLATEGVSEPKHAGYVS